MIRVSRIHPLGPAEVCTKFNDIYHILVKMFQSGLNTGSPNGHSTTRSLAWLKIIYFGRDRLSQGFQSNMNRPL